MNTVAQLRADPSIVDLSQYRLETLHQDGEFILYRGLRQTRAETSPPSILALSPAMERPAPATIKKLEHEFSLKDELDPAWAVRPIALTQHQGRTMLLFEDPDGEPLDRLLRRPLELKQFLRCGIALAAALGQAHRRGLIHKDIKPSNVLANAAMDQVWLTGFGIASRLPRERQSAEPPEFISGTLAYMAPEQTGRMNRSIDSRSDLYALGVTLYEMLTGSLPFTATDPMEWVHSHIARQPVPPGERLKGIPDPVSAIVMKLLAKTAEERYQTAAGLERDLRRCLAQWEADRRIDAFPLGQQDQPDRLLIPEKLYGREREIEKLLASFDRVIKGGTPELVLVAGYSGIGKSSVVNELHKVLVAPRGLFASGKFDQYKRDIPYSTLAQAFQSLTRRLLAKSEADLTTWRAALLEALGPNGRLMIDLVPELKLIIGDQPPVPELPPQDARRRFQLVFRRFIGVFAWPEHPLALFIDDLQWLDAATLDLLEDLLTLAEGVQHLMLIGAYRDNEVTAAHPLIRKLEAIRSAGATVQEITLAPLAAEDVRQLITDTFRCEPERAAPLAQLVHEKTAGNPFFMVQFLHTLAEEGWLVFDYEKAQWSWDLNRINAKRYRDNVVDLMVGRLNRLPLDTQKALQQLACLGNSATVGMLSIILAKSPDEVSADLWDAVRLELVEQLEGSYKFVHDRVQEAAYSLIPEELRDEAHLRIGRQLAAHIPPEKREEAIFDIVNQYNRGAALITSRDEHEQMAELNLLAGKRAKASTAYASALKYLAAGAALLQEDSWQRQHTLFFELELHRAECEFLTGALGAAEERLKPLSTRAANTVERATVARLRLNVYTTLDQSERAVEVCLDYLAQLGVEWQPHPTQEQALGEYERIWSLLDERNIKDLIELPLLSEPAMLGTLDVLTEVVTPALFTDRNLLSLVICRMVNLSLEHGNSDASCFAFVFLGMIAGPHFDNYEAGFQFGRLGYELVEKRGLHRYQARTYMCFGNLVTPWTRHVRTGRDLVRRAFEAANKAGDLTFAAYSRNNLNTNLLAAGAPLAEAQREAEQGLDFAQKIRFGLVIDIITAQLGMIRMLRGLTPTFGSFDYEEFNEHRFEGHLASQPDLALPECWYWIRKLQARVLAGDYRSAIEASLKTQPLLWTSPSFFETAEYEFYGGLARAGFYDSAPVEEQPQHLEALAAHYRQLEIWAENCPENFENRAALVGAEIARIEGRALEAEQLYEQAIRSARANGFVHNEALANELAARFYLARGFEKIAHAYLQDARYGYLCWGAEGKVRQLDQTYPHITKEESVRAPTITIEAPVDSLDLATVIKVSQAVSGEIVLEKLIDMLMRTAIEHAGAARGVLILPHADELRIEAEATASGDTVTVSLRETSVTAAELPESVLHYVVRTRESVILDDASAQNLFSEDSYIRQHHARSLLCLPLLKQAKLIGVLYLENNLALHVFTPTRIAVLKLLASEAAISLENTRLYGELTEREARIRRLVEANIIGIVIWNFEGRVIEANEAFLRMVGYGREDLVSGRVSWREITPDNWRDGDEQALAELAATGVCEPFEKEYFHKDGSRVPVLVGAALLEGGRDEGVAFVLDLTERKRAEEELRASERRYRHLVDTTPAFVHTALPNGDVDFFNHGWEEYVGLPFIDMLGWRWTSAIHAEDAEAFVGKWRAALESGEPFVAEARVRRADGEYRWFLHRSEPLRNEVGRIVKWYGSGIEIEERKIAEEKIREHEAELRQILDLAPQHIAVLAPDGSRLYCNHTALEYSGITLEQWREPGKVPNELVHPEDREHFLYDANKPFLEGKPHEFEARLLRHDGECRWFLFRQTPLKDEQGHITRWYGTATDIQDRKRAEEEIRKENIALREEIIKASMFEEIVGNSPALQQVLVRVAKVAPTDSTVLITGETGTGKELIARAIHKTSKRADRAFVSVNCAAIPPSLIPSELFGHEKGAFTGATGRRLGRFELAEGGTIFLDEVGELPPETQVALLRVLQEREFERVGGNMSIKTNVRLIVATNRDLQACIGAGAFREDLFYRLNVFPIEVPPLRERRKDIPMLVQYFIDRYARELGKSIRTVSKETLDLFQSYAWPGNIRELRNVIERSVIVCETESFSVDESWLSRQPLPSATNQLELRQRLVAEEREAIEAALTESRGRVFGPSGAAASLGIARSTLESKIKTLNIDKNRFKVSDPS
jgi:PAS domain S-box-containing protein